MGVGGGAAAGEGLGRGRAPGEPHPTACQGSEELRLKRAEGQHRIHLWEGRKRDLGDLAVRDPGVDAPGRVFRGLLQEFAKIRKLGPSYLLKGVRWEGVYPGGAILNTSIACSDEPAYLKALDELRVLFDANGFKDAKLNLLRYMAGRENSTHLVVISFPSQVRVAELIDATTDTALLTAWNASVAKIRTTVHNGTYHEVTR